MVLRLQTEYYPVFIPLGFIGLYRYIWFVIRLIAYYLYKPMTPKTNPRYNARKDVTIIVPTIDAGHELIDAAKSWLENDPYEILIITEEKMKGPLEELAALIAPDRIRVLTVPKANKRRQMVEGIRNTKTELLVFSDDDAIWSPRTLDYILACFEDPDMGGVGTSQRVRPIGKRLTVWEVLAGFRLTQRNIEIASSTHIDNGIPCLSGRTAAYRTRILQDETFIFEFTHDFWLGKYPLNSGDDKFLTRWMVSHGWKTYAQVCKEAEVQSTFKNNWHFLKQVLRWTRNTWRSDFRSLFTEGYVWTRHPYQAFQMLEKMFTPLTLIAGPTTFGVLVLRSDTLPLWVIILCYAAWLHLTRIFKLLPHWFQRPQDLIHVTAFLLFNYYFSIMKIYALFTLHVVAWGTRKGVDTEKDEKADKDEKLKRHTSVKITMNRPKSSLNRNADPMMSLDRKNHFASLERNRLESDVIYEEAEIDAAQDKLHQEIKNLRK